MYILANNQGNYVMRNPYDSSKYIATTSPVLATRFTYKQAKTLRRSNRANMKWINSYNIVDDSSGQNVTKANVVITEEDNGVDETILPLIFNECENIIGLSAWNDETLENYLRKLVNNLSYYDSALSDIQHVIPVAKPTADVSAKIVMMMVDLFNKHTQTKQCIKYIKVLQDANKNNYTISKLKAEIEKAKYVDYKGRTEYYEDIIKMVNDRKAKLRKHT